MTNEVNEKKVPISAIKKSYWYSMFFRAGGGFTYSMGVRLACCMGICLEHLYKDKDRLAEEVSKYYQYFDTNVPFFGAVVGILINMEEQRATNPDDIPAESINAMATSLMGPVGNIGDVIQQAIIAPLALSIGISLCGDVSNPSIIGPIVMMLITGTCTIGISYFLWMKTYSVGNGLLAKILEEGLADKLLKAASVMGCVTMGGLIPKFVNITTSVAWLNDVSSFVLQTDLFDAIMPNMLSLAAVFIYLGIFKKGAKPSRVIWISMAVAIALSLLGILGPVPSV